MSDIPEHVLDSVRGWLIFGEGRRDMRSLHFYARQSPNCNASDIPPAWANLPDEAHVTKSMYAEVLYRAFRRAEEKQ